MAFCGAVVPLVPVLRPRHAQRKHVRSVKKIVQLDDTSLGGWWIRYTHYTNKRTSEVDTLLATPYYGRW
jgi:hypothetical protein